MYITPQLEAIDRRECIQNNTPWNDFHCMIYEQKNNDRRK